MRTLEPGHDLRDPMAPYLGVDRTRRRHECWVTGHMVAGLDGTAAVGGKVGALSTAPDQDLFRRMREIADVVMVGAETVRREGYGPVRLDASARAARVERGLPSVPPVAVVSRSLELDPEARVFAEAPDDARTLVITCAGADAARRARLDSVATVVVAGDEQVEPAGAFAALADLGHHVVLCEGGPTWLGQVVAADRLDELCLTLAPMIGGDLLPVCVNPPGASLRGFELRGTLAEGDTLFLRYERPGGGAR